MIRPMGMQLRTAYLPLASQAVTVGVAWQAVTGSASVIYPHMAGPMPHTCSRFNLACMWCALPLHACAAEAAPGGAHVSAAYGGGHREDGVDRAQQQLIPRRACGTRHAPPASPCQKHQHTLTRSCMRKRPPGQLHICRLKDRYVSPEPIAWGCHAGMNLME